MTVLFFLLLILLVLPLWAWLVSRIWTGSPSGVRASFFLIVPTYLWGLHYWRRERSGLGGLLVANTAALLILSAVGFKAANADSKSADRHAKTSPNMEAWCKKQNDATYDPVLQTCVENSKDEARARNQQEDVFGQLSRHLEKKGLKSEIDQSAAASASQPKLVTAEVAQITAFYFLPLSMSQPELSILLCVSEAACKKYAEDAPERGITQFVRNENLLLVLPQEPSTDERIEKLKDAFKAFKSI
jgi:hypothetical protein